MRLVCTPVGRGGLTEAAGQHPREADTGCCALWGPSGVGAVARLVVELLNPWEDTRRKLPSAA